MSGKHKVINYTYLEHAKFSLEGLMDPKLQQKNAIGDEKQEKSEKKKSKRKQQLLNGNLLFWISW